MAGRIIGIRGRSRRGPSWPVDNLRRPAMRTMRSHHVEHIVDTADGRRLAVSDGGDPDGIPLLVHYGTPNSRLQYAPDVANAKEHGLRFITYDRPGYGESSPRPGRTVADCADDVRAICRALNI